MDFVALKKFFTFSKIRKGFAKTCIIWPFNPNVIESMTTFFEQFQGNEKKLFHQVKKKTMQPTTHYKKLRRRKTYLPIVAKYYADAIVSDDEDHHLKGSFKITT